MKESSSNFLNINACIHTLQTCWSVKCCELRILGQFVVVIIVISLSITRKCNRAPVRAKSLNALHIILFLVVGPFFPVPTQLPGKHTALVPPRRWKIFGHTCKQIEKCVLSNIGCPQRLWPVGAIALRLFTTVLQVAHSFVRRPASYASSTIRMSVDNGYRPSMPLDRWGFFGGKWIYLFRSGVESILNISRSPCV